MCRASESGVAAHGINPTGWSEHVSWGCTGWGERCLFLGAFFSLFFEGVFRGGVDGENFGKMQVFLDVVLLFGLIFSMILKDSCVFMCLGLER